MSNTSQLLAGLNVSRETIDALHAFAALVERWNPAINLVSKASLPDLWSRHIVDSAQVFSLCPQDAKRWLDIGSGGGFPGIVVSVLARDVKPNMRTVLVESDRRKAAFLREACRLLSLDADVRADRIESLSPQQADVLSARALAPLSALLGFAEQHLAETGVALFPKGDKYESELNNARKSWSFDARVVPSLLEPSAAILEIRKIKRA
jgi:16S rRNA (guanine527-N7)-methyltransferase